MTGSTEWMDGAVCTSTDPEAFFPDKGGTTAPAKSVCASCDVVEQCLAYALANGHTEGVWGGLSPRQRHALQAGKRVVRVSAPISGHYVHLTAEQVTRAVALRADGLSWADIARSVGAKRGTVVAAVTRVLERETA